MEPAGWQRLAADAQASDPDAIVWRGDHTLPLEYQGLFVLGTPLGSPQFVDRELGKWHPNSKCFWTGSPHVSDLQSALLLLLFCASPRPNYILRILHPCATREFAMQHDDSIRRCFEQLLHTTVSGDRWDIASMPLVMGGLGFEECTVRGHMMWLPHHPRRSLGKGVERGHIMCLPHLPQIINLVFIFSFSVNRDVGAMSSGFIMCGFIQAPCLAK